MAGTPTAAAHARREGGGGDGRAWLRASVPPHPLALAPVQHTDPDGRHGLYVLLHSGASAEPASLLLTLSLASPSSPPPPPSSRSLAAPRKTVLITGAAGYIGASPSAASAHPGRALTSLVPRLPHRPVLPPLRQVLGRHHRQVRSCSPFSVPRHAVPRLARAHRPAEDALADLVVRLATRLRPLSRSQLPQLVPDCARARDQDRAGCAPGRRVGRGQEGARDQVLPRRHLDQERD